MGWASRPSKKDGRDAHPTITIKIISYLIRDPNKIPGAELAIIPNATHGWPQTQAPIMAKLTCEFLNN
ncbi:MULTISPECIES: hypothetical protein [unclassified Microcoleus]|uniref:hypothetical protein n=1 Tax=unclassified Microcoleus TaxID=2642155 RepID=UPI002FD1E412